MKTAEEVLEYPQIEKDLENYLHFERNRIEARNQELITDNAVLEREHRLLREGENFLNSGVSYALEHVNELENHLKLLEKGGILSVAEISDFIPFLNDCGVFASVFAKATESGELKSDASAIVDFSWIRNRLSSVILPDLSIADDASPALYMIRQKIKKEETELGDAIHVASRKYSSYLSEVKETVKGGLPALAVKSAYKNRVHGMVQDISHSGETTFIVPSEILDIQNKIFELKEQENEEIERIIKELSGILTQNIEDIKRAYEASLTLDSVLGRVSYGLSYHGTVAESGEKIVLEDLAHPLLKADSVVRNNFSLGGEKAKILVISGPNAGGKTVLIKAVALAALMNQKGLLTDALGKAVLPLFSSIFFLSGDSQSIMDSLSTFSGHVSALKEGLDNVKPDSLFIVDEIGQGTAPLDGEAIGIAAIDYLEKVGCHVILTSHYDGLKEKAFKDPKCLVGAMIFDEKTIRPTFRYKEGMIGKSYALEVASNMGLNKEIIADAAKYIKKQNQDSGREMLEKVTKLQQENLSLHEELDQKLKEADELLQKREKALEGLTQEKEAIHKKAEDKLEEMLYQKQKDLDLLYKEHKISLQDLAELKGQISKMNLNKDKSLGSYKPKEAKKVIQELKEGDIVRINSLNNSGTIRSVNNEKGNAVIRIGNMDIKARTSDLTFISHKPLNKKPKVAVADSYVLRKTGVPLECNLIGLHVDEARLKLDKYIDDCILLHFHQVRIIHGNGTGALRTMVQNYLKNNPNVDSYRWGGEGEGGVGATVVYLKDHKRK